MRKKVGKNLKEIKLILKSSKVDLPFELKLKVIEVMLDLIERKREFGLFIILGWKDNWRDHTDMPDADQDIYGKNSMNIFDNKNKIKTTVDFDGAILVDSKGNIVHSGIIIEGLKPKVIAEKINPGSFRDLSEQFGFKHKVHSRHLSAITASYIFKGTTVFTISEESRSFHIFEGGKILYSIE